MTITLRVWAMTSCSSRPTRACSSATARPVSSSCSRRLRAARPRSSLTYAPNSHPSAGKTRLTATTMSRAQIGAIPLVAVHSGQARAAPVAMPAQAACRRGQCAATEYSATSTLFL